MKSSQELGTETIPKLLVKMSVPAAVGFLVMSVYFIVDTIFVGRWVGTLGIAAVSVVMPIVFLCSSVGMAIGIGGASVISRALGKLDHRHACRTFGNMVSLTILLSILMISIGYSLEEKILVLFGAYGDILAPAKVYFRIILIGAPCLAWAMMSNNVMRAEGRPKMAMLSMLIPAVVNLVLDPILIVGFDMGIRGAAWATSISYFITAGFAIWFFFSGQSELRIWSKALILRSKLVKEIAAIGSVTLARQGTISLLRIVLNFSLFKYGGELAVAVYGVINNMMMFALFPVLGIVQGFLPIVGFNYGGEKWERVRKTLTHSIKVGTIVAIILFVLILSFATPIIAMFTTDPALLAAGPPALVITFLATPLIAAQLIGSGYFQAIGKAFPALLLTLSKQGFFLIPLIFILPFFFGLDGIWWSFPIADVLAAAVTIWYLRKEMNKNLLPKLKEQKSIHKFV